MSKLEPESKNDIPKCVLNNISKNAKIIKTCESDFISWPVFFDTKKWKYNKVYVVKENNKVFAYNPYGKKVFLPKKWIEYQNEYAFFFQKEGKKVLLGIEHLWGYNYYTEDWEEYHLEKLREKMKRKIVAPVTQKLIKVLETIFPHNFVKIPEKPTAKQNKNKFN